MVLKEQELTQSIFSIRKYYEHNKNSVKILEIFTKQ